MDRRKSVRKRRQSDGPDSDQRGEQQPPADDTQTEGDRRAELDRDEMKKREEQTRG